VALSPSDAALAQSLVSGTCGTQVVRFKEGHTYEGEWREGLMHGTGTMEFTDGVKYEGHFENNRISGCGVRSPASTWACGQHLHAWQAPASWPEPAHVATAPAYIDGWVVARTGKHLHA
jgi:hypothetical protein